MTEREKLAAEIFGGHTMDEVIELLDLLVRAADRCEANSQQEISAIARRGRDALRRAAAMLRETWQPIETAPIGKLIIAGWTDEGNLDDVQLIRLLVSRVDWTPNTRHAWQNQGTANYGSPKQPHQWPAVWMYPPESTP